MFPYMHRIVPPGKINGISIDHHAVNVENTSTDKLTSSGVFTCLWIDDTLMMSDALTERVTCQEVVQQACGDVLIGGLGIGMILLPILSKPEVQSVTVLELRQEVINLVEPAIRAEMNHRSISKPLLVIRADVFDWLPPEDQKYDVIFMDIWPTAEASNLSDMEMLHERYGPRLAPGGWLNCWLEVLNVPAIDKARSATKIAA